MSDHCPDCQHPHEPNVCSSCADMKVELLSVLEHCGEYAVRVCEGGGADSLAASIAVTVAGLRDQRNHYIHNFDDASNRAEDAEAQLELFRSVDNWGVSDDGWIDWCGPKELLPDAIQKTQKDYAASHPYRGHAQPEYDIFVIQKHRIDRLEAQKKRLMEVAREFWRRIGNQRRSIERHMGLADRYQKQAEEENVLRRAVEIRLKREVLYCNCKGVHPAGECPNPPRDYNPPVPTQEEILMFASDPSSACRALRERTGAGMMDAKRALESAKPASNYVWSVEEDDDVWELYLNRSPLAHGFKIIKAFKTDPSRACYWPNKEDTEIILKALNSEVK